MDSAKREEIKKQLAEKELAEFKNGLPTEEPILTELFGYLDIRLRKVGCDHTTDLTRKFLEKRGVDNVVQVMRWLSSNGGFCDCEVLANVEGLFGYTNPGVIAA